MLSIPIGERNESTTVAHRSVEAIEFLRLSQSLDSQIEDQFGVSPVHVAEIRTEVYLLLEN